MNSLERYVQDVEIKSVDSYRDQSGKHNQDRREFEDLRRPQELHLLEVSARRE